MKHRIRVDGTYTEFVIDTGAEVSTVTESTCKALNLRLKKSDRVLSSADGSPLSVLGRSEVLLESKLKSTKASVYVLKGSRFNLLGLCELKNFSLLAIVNAVCKDEFDPVKQYPNVFRGLGIMPSTFRINLREDATPRRLFSPRPIAAGLRDQAKAEIDKMLEMSVIEPVEEPTDWCSGLTIAPKPGGKIRMCIDLTALNKSVQREVYPLPRISDMLTKLSEGRVFSKLDANSGFWQIKMDSESKLLTTFVTPWGRFCFKRMPFGISSAPEFFQREMEKILQGLEGVVCMMDDVLVFGSTPAEHWSRLRKVLEKISASGMTLKKEKCEFACSEVKFMGHIIGAAGIKPDPDKVKAILELEPPRNKTEGRRFTGMVNYLSKFSAKLAELCMPIYAVTGNKHDWYWGEDQKKAFKEIKFEISKAPVLSSFDIKKRHRVSADASKNALGAVLLQLNENLWQPVVYASRILSDAETRYAMVEKEALAATWACEKFDYYLVGRKFEIETDHKPLIPILGQKDICDLPIRVQRFKLRLMRYDFEIFHTPGKNMLLADALSRPCASFNGSTDKDKALSNEVELFARSVVDSTKSVDCRLEEVLQVAGGDNTYQRAVKFVLNGWPGSEKDLDSVELKKLFVNRYRLTLIDNLLYFDDRVYIPEVLRDKYLSICHEGHQGINKCRRRARRLFWWPGLSSDMKDYVAKCNTCIRNSQIKHQPMFESELPDGPWEIVATDLFNFENENYLVLIDYYTRWIEAIWIPRQTASVVINALKNVFARLGVPRIVRSDNGPCYNSKEFLEFAEAYGFYSITSSPRYPESNGLAEGAVRTVKHLWQRSTDKNTALMAYRTTPLATGYSPSELMYGRSVRTPLGKPVDREVDYDDFEIKDFEQKQLEKDRFDKKYNTRALPELEPGDRVWVKAPSDHGAEGVIVGAHATPESYWVKIGNSEIRRNRKHLKLLEPDLILIASEEPLAEECETDPTESEPRVDLDRGSSSTKGEDLGGLGHTDQAAEAQLENRSDIVITKSGRQSRKPHRSDYMYY